VIVNPAEEARLRDRSCVRAWRLRLLPGSRLPGRGAAGARRPVSLDRSGNRRHQVFELSPPWVGDAERERHLPPVEVLRYTPRGAARTPEGDKAIAPLEDRRRRLLQELLALPERKDRGPDEVQRQLQAYQQLAYELDRLDPKGAAARKAEDYEVMERIRRRLEVNAR